MEQKKQKQCTLVNKQRLKSLIPGIWQVGTNRACLLITGCRVLARIRAACTPVSRTVQSLGIRVRRTTVVVLYVVLVCAVDYCSRGCTRVREPQQQQQLDLHPTYAQIWGQTKDLKIGYLTYFYYIYSIDVCLCICNRAETHNPPSDDIVNRSF